MWDTLFVTQILKNRNFTPEEIQKYIRQHSEYDIGVPNFFSFLKLLENSQSILIVGDYDVDGIVSSSILCFILREIFKDKKRVSVFIPNRFRHGYGLNKNTVNFIMDKYKNKVDTLITVDNGISSHYEIGLLKKEGLKVIVIDHHRFDGGSLGADVVIHPHFFDLGYGYLCASGIVYKIALFLLNWLKNNHVLEKLFTFLAGLATIADVVPLLEDNRKLVKKLFNLLSSGFIPYPILKLFVNAYGRDMVPNSTFHFSYIIIPRLNAPGRIDNPYISFNLIYKTIVQTYNSLEDGLDKELSEIENINKKRQEIQKRVLDTVLKNIEEKELYKNNVIIPDYIQGDGLELGVIGIVAGRISSMYRKPSLVFVKSDNVLKGSVRNPIESLDITEIIGNLKDLVIKFGGHRKAAGVEIKPENFEEFKRNMNLLIHKNYSYNVDLELTPFFFDKFVKYINSIVDIMEPFGEKNEKPILKLVNFNPSHFGVYSRKVFFKGETVKDGSVYVKLEKFLNNSVFFEILMQNNKDKHLIVGEKILFYERNFYKDFHFVIANIKSIESLKLLFDSYVDFLIVCKPDRYSFLKKILSKSHFVIFEEDINEFMNLLTNLPESVFMTNENVLRGVIVFCIDFVNYFLDFKERLQKLNKGIIFINIRYE
ncbi:MAG: DHH family phosphoesterase [Candidatus Calescibacterium sp.]|nr:DHH family phosphoesterase [Candidatus Calescibacterium sp.]MDW8132693.1 DHH family phosphoesterase [Candidatus Calescibacterium sp.]